MFVLAKIYYTSGYVTAISIGSNIFIFIPHIRTIDIDVLIKDVNVEFINIKLNKTNVMLIPLNTATRDDLCLSIVPKEKDFSVAIVSIVNGFGLYRLPSHYFDVYNDEIHASAVIEDYKVIKGTNLFDCIDECMEQIKDLMSH